MRCTPPSSWLRIALPERAPISASSSSPPSTRLRPLASTSVVASTIRGVRSTASIRALSSFTRVGSVNWTS